MRQLRTREFAALRSGRPPTGGARPLKPPPRTVLSPFINFPCSALPLASSSCQGFRWLRQQTTGPRRQALVGRCLRTFLPQQAKTFDLTTTPATEAKATTHRKKVRALFRVKQPPTEQILPRSSSLASVPHDRRNPFVSPAEMISGGLTSPCPPMRENAGAIFMACCRASLPRRCRPVRHNKPRQSEP